MIAKQVPEGVVGLPELVADCIRSCDTDMRRELWGVIAILNRSALARDPITR